MKRGLLRQLHFELLDGLIFAILQTKAQFANFIRKQMDVKMISAFSFGNVQALYPSMDPFKWNRKSLGSAHTAKYEQTDSPSLRNSSQFS
jgi:hypothetical protein